MRRFSPETCVRCKGYKKLCGLAICPILEAFKHKVVSVQRIKGNVSEGATPPSVVVGEHGYPKVKLYFMLPPGLWGEDAKYRDDPVSWSAKREPLETIIRLRSELVSAVIRVNVKSPWDLYQSEVGLSQASLKPVASEVVLKRSPVPVLRFDGILRPQGPSSEAIKIKISDNPVLDPTVEKLLWDDVKASEAIVRLYEKGIPVYVIERLMSLGFIGRLKNRRLVPTRWAITAVDDTISRWLRYRMRDYGEIKGAEVYYHEYLGNRFLIVLMPGEGSVEWIEVWKPFTLWTSGARSSVVWSLIEDPLGRRGSDDGGFSAARLSLLAYLTKRHVKADAVIIREILPSYYAPVGNWHIRESVKIALNKGPILRDPTLKELEEASRRLLDSGPNAIKRSKLLMGKVRRIDEFI